MSPWPIQKGVTVLVALIAVVALVPGGPLKNLPTGRPLVVDMPFVTCVSALVLLKAGATSQTAGSTLQRLNRIRAGLATISANDLSGRVPQPADNINALTGNNPLNQPERADEQTRQALERHRQFAGDVSHELRTPLAGLRLRLEEAQLQVDDSHVCQVLDRVLEDVDRLQAIVTDLLLLARTGAEINRIWEKVDLGQLVRAEVSRRIDQDAVRLYLDPAVTVDAVPTQITRVLTNLLDNAHRHARRAIMVRVRRNGTAAELIVTDDGDGVAEKDRERIFERFLRLESARSRDRGGTGLGLAIARDLARAHRGTLHVEDGPGGGAQFVLRLPLGNSRPGGLSAEVAPDRRKSRTS
ncbi:sensor histidine kinase [Nonomuraea terrae]|uniref:sensor histidine kinase n=1 Tax=Nonomuraea terrae TaxID=2530383 RepID=UPI0037A0B48B